MQSSAQADAAWRAAIASRKATVDIFACPTILLPPPNAARLYYHQGGLLALDSLGNNLLAPSISGDDIDGGAFQSNPNDHDLLDGGAF